MENAVAWVVCGGTRGKTTEMSERKSDIKVMRDTSPESEMSEPSGGEKEQRQRRLGMPLQVH